MAVAGEACPEVDELAGFACGELGSGRARIVAHLDRCADCRRVVAAAALDDDAADADHDEERVQTGPRIGRFVVLRMLGEGAMGVVHLAYDPGLRRNVAVKVIKPDSGDQLAAERLLLEAQTAAQLSHPNTVTIYDVGVHDGAPYVAMEYVEGTTLAAWLKRGAGWRDALSIMLAAGEGLAAAHKAGLVHRDFKPGNILVGDGGIVKVSDFGLARFANERASLIKAREEALELPRSSRAVTSTGVLVGTPAYTSPEQFSGATATAASDQFAFGVALYRALYGVRPFRGPTLYAVYESICNDPAPPPPKDARIPLALWPVVARALAKDPAQRYPDMPTLLASVREAAGLDAYGLDGEHCPFPGLVSFAESDARVYFGRGAEVNEVLGRLRDHGCAAIVGPSGAGKSSFVRALVIPRLRRDNPSGDVITLHPGPRPLVSLARALAPLVESGARSVGELEVWLREDPTRFASVIVSHARHRDGTVLVYADQLEELYTQCPDRAERLAFARALAEIGRDPSQPAQLSLTLRSDFLDRAAECGELIARITAGFVFLPPPTHATLAEALIGPLAIVGYELEDPAIAAEIASDLEDQTGAFPLLQFVGGRLWEARDRERRAITRASVAAIGAVAGALAAHADQVLAQLRGDAAVARAVLLRLVTPERTRLAIPARELGGLGPAGRAEHVIDVLVRGRLLVADGDTVELVHEALIAAWPTLRRWLDDDAGEARLLADLSASARRWDAAARPEGMLWTGEPARQVFSIEQRGARLTDVESAFVAASRRIARRAGRRRSLLVASVLLVLAGISITATSAYFRVRKSEEAATAAAAEAQRKSELARAAEERATSALAKKTEAEASKQLADQQTKSATEDAALSREQLVKKAADLERALSVARDERRRAQDSATQLAEAVKTEKALRAEVDRALGEANAARAALQRKYDQVVKQMPDWK